jgi:hypothetical protein
MVRRELSPRDRNRICELASIRWTPTQIHKLHPKWGFSAMKATIRRESSRSKNYTKPRSGRPRGLSEMQRDHAYNITNHINPHIAMRDLLREVNNAVKKRTLQGLLREINKKKWLQRKRPQITADHAAARYA